jgi:iron complex transport system substrate-binding protein
MVGNEELTGTIVNVAYHLHTQFGPGLLESAYEALFARMLEKEGLHVVRQLPVALEYDGIRLEEAYRADLLVESQVLVELKAVEALNPVHTRQVLTYLRLLDLPVGLLINFGAARLDDGLRRVLNHRASRSALPGFDLAGAR